MEISSTFVPLPPGALIAEMDALQIMGSFATVIIVIGVLAMVISLIIGVIPKRTRPAKLVGTLVPEAGLGIDLGRRYDIRYSAAEFGSSPSVEYIEGVRIHGYVGTPGDQPGDDKFYISSRWLAVEFSDGRKAFLMPRGITLLRESRVQD